MQSLFRPFLSIHVFVFAFFIASPLFGQQALQLRFEQIADSLNGKLGVSAFHIETGERVSFNGNKRYPMQSVYKFPIAMVMLNQVDAGKFRLQDSIKVDKSEYISEKGHSPLRDKYPKGVTLPLKEIIEYNISQSDGTACDVLLRLLGGTAKTQAQLREWGLTDIAIATTEMVQVAHDTIQYQNWATPEGMNELLVLFHQGKQISPKSKAFLWDQMSISNKWFDKRIKRLLPPDTPLAHKTGTAWTYNGFNRATNDAGIITLPDGSHLAISVFVSDAQESQYTREMTIAKAAKAAYDYWTTK